MESESGRIYKWSADKKKRTIRNNKKFSKPGKSTNSRVKSGGVQTPVIDVADSSDDSSDNQYGSRSIQQQQQWQKYDELDDKTDDNEQLEGGDFSILKNNPTGGSHFIFSSEKHWEEQTIEKSEISGNFFTLNLKLIKNGLETIPFYKRMDYDSSIFTHKELKRMNELAEGGEKDYQKILEEYELEKLKNSNENLTKSSKASSSSSRVNSANLQNFNKNNNKSVHSLQEKNEELDALLNMTKNIENIKIGNENDNNLDEIINDNDDAEDKNKIKDSNNSSQSVVSENNETEKNEDIQEWLDSILNE